MISENFRLIIISLFFLQSVSSSHYTDEFFVYVIGSFFCTFICEQLRFTFLTIVIMFLLCINLIFICFKLTLKVMYVEILVFLEHHCFSIYYYIDISTSYLLLIYNFFIFDL